MKTWYYWETRYPHPRHFPTAGQFKAESDAEAVDKFHPFALANVVDRIYRLSDNDVEVMVHQRA